MAEQDWTIDLRAKLNPETGRVEVSLLSEEEPKDIEAALGPLLKFRGTDGAALEGLLVETSKIDPASMPASARLRAMWEKTTCDIIK